MSAFRIAADADRRDRLAGSFGAVAPAYHRYRPGYPERAVRLALPDPPCAGGEVGDVLDLAAGTGKLTEAVLPWCRSVVAVEPSAGMREELAGRFPSVQVLDGRAESIPLADGAVDAVLVGQAFHWFEPDAALPEMARVLRPRGVLSLLANAERDTPAFHQLWVDIEVAKNRLDRPFPRRFTTSGGPVEPSDPDGPPFRHPAFAIPVHTVVPWRRPLTDDELVADQHTHSTLLTSTDQQRTVFDDEMRAALARHRAAHPAGERLELPMECHVWRAVRRSS